MFKFKKKLPIVYIHYSRLLDGQYRELFKSKNEQYPEMNIVSEDVDRIRNLFEEKNKGNNIIKMIGEVLGVFPAHDFEVSMFYRGLMPQSSPLLLPIHFRKEKSSDLHLIKILTHELVHRFTASPYKEDYSTKDYWRYVRDTYKNEPMYTQNHIIVYAVLEKVLPNIIGQEKTNWFLDNNLDPDYKRAIDIVREKGPDVLIKEFRDYVKK